MQKNTPKYLRWPALLLAVVLVLALGGKLIHNYLVEQNEQLVHSVAQTLLPALLANDQQQVAELLKSLETYPGIERIELISSEGATLASLTRVGDQLDPSTATEFALASADNTTEHLQLAAPITFDSLILANLHIAINLWPAYLRIMSWLGALLIIPSVLYVLIKQMRIKVRFERLAASSGGGGGGAPSEPFNLHQVMKDALDEAQIKVEYQPIRRLKDGGLYGFELVVCWHHPSGQTLYLSPSDFITLAKKWGMFLPVGEWVLQTACQQAAQWQRVHGPLVMCFNISQEQLLDAQFGKKVRDVCAQTDYPSQLIEFEINESVLAKQSDAKQAVEKFLEQGLNLTIDQFGLSRQSLDFISTLPVQKIKLDPKLVANLEQDAVIQNLVQATIEHALDHNILVMSDGLSRTAQIEMLAHLGCGLGQGQEMGQALSAQQFENYLKTQNSTLSVRAHQLTLEPSA